MSLVTTACGKMIAQSCITAGRTDLSFAAALQVYVILFGVGKSETEGIYSLRAMSRADGTPKDTIVAFEDLEDAQR